MDHLEQDTQGTTSSTQEKYVKTANHPFQDSRSNLRVTNDERIPKLHLKTPLAIFTVSTMYFAQVYCLVGAGAVRTDLIHSPKPTSFPGTSPLGYRP